MRETKDSGVDWIGEVPVNWEIVPTPQRLVIFRFGAAGANPLKPVASIRMGQRCFLDEREH